MGSLVVLFQNRSGWHHAGRPQYERVAVGMSSWERMALGFIPKKRLGP
jgi:hypothetical protein